MHDLTIFYAHKFIAIYGYLEVNESLLKYCVPQIWNE